MRALEDLSNRLADMDWAWWPLVSLRPARDEELDLGRIMVLSAFFGPVTGISGYLAGLVGWYAQAGAWPALSPVLLFLAALGGVPLFAGLFSATTALFWNRRARRLRAQRDPG